MKIKYTFVCLFLIILYVSAQRSIESKLEHHNTTGKMEEKDTIENVNNEKNETVPLPPSGKDKSAAVIIMILMSMCITLITFISVTILFIKYCRKAQNHTTEVTTVRTASVTFRYPLQYIAITQNEITQQRPPSLCSDTAGETDQLLNGKRKYVNFHRTIDATLSNIAIHKLSEMVKSVGLLYWNDSPRGTVIRIGTKFILTAWHVIDEIVLTPGEIDTNGRPKTSMDLQALKKKDVIHVGFTKNAKSKDHDLRCGLLPKICFLDRDLDACILELDYDSALLPAAFVDFMDFQLMWDRQPQSKFVHVIGQHPKRMIVVLDAGCKVITKEDEKANEIKEWLEKNANNVIRNGHSKRDFEECYKYYFESENHLLIDTYLEFGASGGAVVSFTPAGNIALVGVLLQGIPKWYWNKEGIEQGYSNEVRIEIACPISNILLSKEWTDAEKRRIFGQDDISIEIEEEMETDDGEKNAVDKMFAALTLDD